jgi:hypothetical protein
MPVPRISSAARLDIEGERTTKSAKGMRARGENVSTGRSGGSLGVRERRMAVSIRLDGSSAPLDTIPQSAF